MNGMRDYVDFSLHIYDKMNTTVVAVDNFWLNILN